MTKVYRPSERPWSDGLTLQEYQQIARAAVGRDRAGKAEDDCVKAMFHPDQPASPGVRCPKKRKQTEMLWIEKLEVADGKKAGGASPSKRARLNTVGPRRKTIDVGNAENIAEAREVPIDENTPEAGTEGLRARLGMARLTSVTNVTAAAASSPVRHPPGSGPGSSRVSEPSPVFMRDLPPTDKTPSSAEPPRASPPVATPPGMPLPQTPPPTTAKPAPSLQGPQPTLILKREDDDCSRVLDVRTNSASPATLHHFLQDSVVWLARPPRTARPSWRAPSCAVIPKGNQVSTLEAVTIACGWGSTPPCKWSKRGVVFVDVFEVLFLQDTLHELASRRAALLGHKDIARCKPILILDMKMLAYDTLDETLIADEVESRAICRFG